MARVEIFDLDGTLLDSGDVWRTIDERFLHKRGLTLPDDYARAVSVMHLGEAADYTIARFSLNEQAEDIVAEWRQMAIEAYATAVPMKEGAMEYLTARRAAGVRMAVATALVREPAEAALRHHGILDWFETVVYADEVGAGKSSPAVYLATAEQMGASPAECTVYEDTLGGVRSAKAAGMYTIALEDKGSIPDREIIRSEADEYWETFKI
ncbi:MAG: HAD family phosphatase [Ruminococcaceae bacterium]|nr:HAD family phosphatase [Oscillospiraceae bacterium]